MNLSVVILAAGRGKRMKSDIPKVLHRILGRPMLQYVTDAVKKLKPSRTVVVIGNGAEEVKRQINDQNLSFVLQEKLLGTGNALAIARGELKKGTVLVLNGDCPLITSGTLKRLLAMHRRNRNMLSFVSLIDEAASGYGRILRDSGGKVAGIIEDKHATSDQKNRFRELNGGVYLFEYEALKYIDRIKKNASSGEYYLTDIISILSGTGLKIESYKCSPEEVRGVNKREELQEISGILKKRVISGWMRKGVTFLDPATSMVHASVTLGSDTVIYPNTYLEGKTSIGKKCTVYPGARIIDSRIGNNSIIKDCTLIENSRVGDRSVLGPFAHVRPESIIGNNVKIGNFVEIKKSSIGNGSKASHLTYLGDADIGSNVNIGAGTITCNYDGKNKFRTKIDSGVFIGSDSQLIAPVTVGKGAYVAAGATITKNVPSGALAISRAEQRNIENWIKIRTGSKKKQNRK